MHRRRQLPLPVLTLLLAGGAVGLCPGPGLAQQAPLPRPLLQSAPGGGSEEGALFLLLPMGAQGVGLGRAMTAVESAESAFWNPAGLAGLDGTRLLLYHGNQVIGDATALAAVLVRPGTGAVGLAYGLLDIERFEVTDEFGQVVGSIVVRGHQGILSGAARIGSRVRVGTNVKLIRFGMSCRGQCPEGTVQSTSFAVDLGAQLGSILVSNLDLGVVVAHLGSGMRVQNTSERDPLPTRLRVAASYLVLREFLEEEVSFRFLGEVEDRMRDPGSPAFYLGSEVRVGSQDQIYVRAGYVFGDENQIDGAAVGLGLRYERFEFGIARSLARGGPTAEREPVHLTLGVSL